MHSDAVDALYDSVLEQEVQAYMAAVEEFPQDFFDYVLDNKPLQRPLTVVERAWLSANIKVRA